MLTVHELSDLLEFGGLRPAMMDDEEWLVKVGFIQMTILRSLEEQQHPTLFGEASAVEQQETAK